MDFSPNKTPIEVIKEDSSGGTYFRDIYSNVNKKWYKKSWKEVLLIRSIIVRIVMMLVLINIVLNAEHR